MSEQEVKPKKRWPFILAAIIPGSIIAFMSLWFILGLVDTWSLSFVSSLRNYSLSVIYGKVEIVDDDTYRSHVSPFQTDHYFWAGIFPEHIPSDGAKFFFFAETVEPHSNYCDRCEVYLCCDWEENDYDSEKNRLSALNEQPQYTLRKRDDLFPFPAFIYRYESGYFVYTLFDESAHIIHYVALQEIGSADDVVFDYRLVPTKPWG